MIRQEMNEFSGSFPPAGAPIVAASPMKLTIIIPCYNEKNTIGRIIDAVRAAPYATKEIIVIDDCSNDGTREILANDLSGKIDRLVFHESNQ
jgi:glycosyltransferase involved in cell wall biosynthesis